MSRVDCFQCFQNSGFLSIKKRRVRSKRPEKGDTDQESARRRQQGTTGSGSTEDSTGTRASVKRTLSKAVEAAKEGVPQNVSFDTLFQTGEIPIC